MKTTSQEYSELKKILLLTEAEFRHFHQIWERAKVFDIDSRFVGSDGLFLAQKGLVTDGHSFIPEIIAKGAWVIADPFYPRQSLSREKRILRIPNLSNIAGRLGSLFYHDPSKKLRIVGVTGTDGKTSTTRILAEAYHRWGFHTAGIGTLGVYMVGRPNLRMPHHDIPNTTPDPIILQRILYSLHRRGIDTVVMEVSSHGLTLGRVKEVAFDSGIWINLSPEHLDYHVTLENYARTKSRLFELLEHSPKKIKHGVIGLDSFVELADKKNLPWIQEVMSRVVPQVKNYPINFFHCQLRKSRAIHTLSQIFPPGMNQLVNVYSRRSARRSQEVIVQTSKNLGAQKKVISTSLLGQFNAQNLTAAFLEIEYFRRKTSPRPPWPLIRKAWRTMKIKGRLEEFPLQENCHPAHPLFNKLQNCRLYIDFAHTPQALEKVLSTLWDAWKSPLLCVFGCGGDRDKAKRKPMGAVACRGADVTLITDDNPRTENPGSIRNTIAMGWEEEHLRLTHTRKKTMKIIAGRKEAIREALSMVPSGGVVLLAGKGHEDYQIIGKTKNAFDEREILKEILSKPHS